MHGEKESASTFYLSFESASQQAGLLVSTLEPKWQCILAHIQDILLANRKLPARDTYIHMNFYAPRLFHVYGCWLKSSILFPPSLTSLRCADPAAGPVPLAKKDEI